MLRSTTGLPSSSLITCISSKRVTPSRMSSVTGGVTNTPSLSMKRFSAEPSETWPSTVRTIASALAKSEAGESGFDEAVVLTVDGHRSEGSAGDLFMLNDGGVVAAPETDALLEGLT